MYSNISVSEINEYLLANFDYHFHTLGQQKKNKKKSSVLELSSWLFGAIFGEFSA